MPVIVEIDDSGQKTFRSVSSQVANYWNVPGLREKKAWKAREYRAAYRGAPQCPQCGCYDDFHTPACPVFVGMVERLSALTPEVAIESAQPTLAPEVDAPYAQPIVPSVQPTLCAQPNCGEPNCGEPEWLDGLCFAHARAAEAITDIPTPERKEGGWMI